MCDYSNATRVRACVLWWVARPLEEIRATYGPVNYALTEYINRIHVLLALVANYTEDDPAYVLPPPPPPLPHPHHTTPIHGQLLRVREWERQRDRESRVYRPLAT
jgi:hypothetical protein